MSKACYLLACRAALARYDWYRLSEDDLDGSITVVTWALALPRARLFSLFNFSVRCDLEPEAAASLPDDNELDTVVLASTPDCVVFLPGTLVTLVEVGFA